MYLFSLSCRINHYTKLALEMGLRITFDLPDLRTMSKGKKKSEAKILFYKRERELWGFQHRVVQMGSPEMTVCYKRQHKIYFLNM